ncbi:MAG: hypothetical protein AABY32_05760 [Nanoarchaeota archaeon]
MEIEKKRIGVDIDDTSVDFVGNYILYFNQKYKANLKKEDFKTCSFNKTIGGTMEESINLVNEFYKSNLFKKMFPLPNSVEIIKLLKQAGYELFVITSRPDFLKAETEVFIDKYFSNNFSDIFFSYNYYTKRQNGGKSKAEICLDKKISFMIDDSLEYCKQCAEKGIESLLFGNFPWNQDGEFGDKIRVKDWLKVGEKLLK